MYILKSYENRYDCQITKSYYSTKTVREDMFLIYAYHLKMVYMSTKFCTNVLKGFKVTNKNHFYLKMTYLEWF